MAGVLLIGGIWKGQTHFETLLYSETAIPLL